MSGRSLNVYPLQETRALCLDSQSQTTLASTESQMVPQGQKVSWDPNLKNQIPLSSQLLKWTKNQAFKVSNNLSPEVFESLRADGLTSDDFEERKPKFHHDPYNPKNYPSREDEMDPNMPNVIILVADNVKLIRNNAVPMLQVQLEII